MNQQLDENCIQQIRSYDSSQQDKIDTKNKQPNKISLNKQAQTQRNYPHEDDDLFGASVYQKKKMYYKEQIKPSQRKSSSSSEWNSDTDEIKFKQQKNIVKNQLKGSQIKDLKKNPSPPIKYPQIKEIKSQVDKDSHKKQEKMSLGNKFHEFRLNLANSYEDEEFDINVSMIGQRSKNSQGDKDRSAKKQQNNLEVIKTEKKNQIVYNNQNDDATAFKSVYLSNTKLEAKKFQVQFKAIGKMIYWIFEDKQIQISYQNLEFLMQQFYKNSILLPLISDQQFKSSNAHIYLKVYTKFLNKLFPELFKNVISLLKSSNSGGKLNSEKSMTPKSSKNLGKFLYDQYLMKFVKSFSYSKAEILRNNQTKKLSMLNLINKLQNNNQLPIKQKINQLEYQIGILQLFVSIQNSQKYCQKNSEGIDQGTWKNHSKKLLQLRRKWVEIIQSQQNNFSFKI